LSKALLVRPKTDAKQQFGKSVYSLFKAHSTNLYPPFSTCEQLAKVAIGDF
jgi:hypothetical protein